MTESRAPSDDASGNDPSGNDPSGNDPSGNDPSGNEDTGDGLAEFETAIAELESIVATLESGEVGLEQALTRFERGVALTRQCQRTLNNAELRVDQLLGADDASAAPEVAEFDVAPDDKPGDGVNNDP